MARPRILSLILISLALLLGSADAQRHPGDNRRLPCAAQPNQKTLDLESRRDYRGCQFAGSLSQPETTARRFLQHYARVLGMPENLDDISLRETKFGLASAHSRFQQSYRGVPVFGVNLSVHQGRDGSVTAFHTNYQVEPVAGLLRTKIVRRGAIARAAEAAGMQHQRLPPRARKVWFPTAGRHLQIAHEVWIYSAEPLGDFLTVVDGQTGKILFQENRMAFETGEGLVFWPNPMQTTGDWSFDDAGDATSALLDAERFRVTLEGLDSGTDRLKGEFADLTLGGGEIWSFAEEADRVYEYDRDDPRFEEVNIYHTIDQIQRYIHTLGFDEDTGSPNGIRDRPSLANAHWNADDQSFYSTGDDAVHFGDGGVDDGEDGGIIAHEYGHAIQHDQNSCWGGGEMGAMGEGFGDYLAASFFATAGDEAYQSAHAACVGEWDASSYSGTSPPCLRRVDGSKQYPDDLTGSVHGDGEIWSRFLWEVRSAIDPATADQLVFEHHFAVPCDSTMTQGALALMQADSDLNGAANLGAIRAAACDRGIFSGEQCGGLSLLLAASPTPAVSGESLAYTLTVRNDDTSVASGVLAVATVPAGTSYLAGSASDGGSEASGTVSWPAFDIAAGGQEELSFAVTVLASGGGGTLFADDMEVGGSHWVVTHGEGSADWALTGENAFGGSAASGKVPTIPVGATPCEAGKAGVFSCHKVDLEYFYPISAIGGGEGNDGWGWTDPSTNAEYVLMGRSNGTAFIDVSTPSSPVYLGNLPTHSGDSDWRDLKVYQDHAFIVSEASAHGLQVFDLTRLRSATSPPETFTETAHLGTFGSAHNIAINEDSGFAYVVGAEVCSGGLYIVDISDPENPTYAGCHDEDGYTHDVQCVIYSGPDSEHVGKEICFAYNEDTLTIVDVTNKSATVELSRSSYAGSAYTHQGWLAKGQTYLLLNDEADETTLGHKTKTYIVDVSDLESPQFTGTYLGTLSAIDHNLYTEGDFVYEANYTSGLRILKLSDIASGNLCEVASFDVYPDSDSAVFAGAWSSYPYFKSGLVAVMTIEGLALLRPHLSDPTCVGAGEGSGQSWFAQGVDSLSDQYLEIAGQFEVPTGAQLRFWHDFDFEEGFDGGVLEIAVDGGSWTDLEESFVSNGYTGEISDAYLSAIGGRNAFTGSSSGYILSVVDLSDYVGSSVRIRFRAATDSSVGQAGWYVDDVSITNTSSLEASASVTAADTGTITQDLSTVIGSDGGTGGAVCGDSVVDLGEACDDGGESAACDADCTEVLCGDATTNSTAGEACDDGAATASCDTDCSLPECGDGVMNSAAGEACDDGNPYDHDGCSATCELEAALSLDERRCLSANAAWAGKVVSAQMRENESCAKDGSKNRLGDVSLESCLRADRRGKLAALRAKLEAAQADRCAVQPPFGFVSGAAIMEVIGAKGAALATDILGDDPEAMLVDATVRVDRLRSVCQLTTQKFVGKLLTVSVKEFMSCVKKEVANRGDPVATTSRLGGCLDVLAADSGGKVARTVAKLTTRISKRCIEPGIDLTEILDSDCAAETSASAVAACLNEAASCRACTTAGGVFGLSLDCDGFDDGVTNSSCGDP